MMIEKNKITLYHFSHYRYSEALFNYKRLYFPRKHRVSYSLFFLLYTIANARHDREPITPTIKLRINTKSLSTIPYTVHIAVPTAKIEKVTREIFSADFVVYSFHACGKYPIDIVTPTIVVSIWNIFITIGSFIISRKK